jgi:hypothetical protein
MISSGLTEEAWFAERIRQHGVTTIFDGTTDRETRKERFRAAIRQHGLEAVIVGKGRDGKPTDYAACFARLYGEAL